MRSAIIHYGAEESEWANCGWEDLHVGLEEVSGDFDLFSCTISKYAPKNTNSELALRRKFANTKLRAHEDPDEYLMNLEVLAIWKSTQWIQERRT